MIFKWWDEFRPQHSENLLKNEGNVVLARETYNKYKPQKLEFLFHKRFDWMNEYIKKGDKVLDIGSGTGIARDFIRKDCNLLLSDFANHPWLDLKMMDALNTKLPDNSISAICCSNMIHHIAFPKKFLLEMSRILKPGGYLLVQEVNCSIMMKIMLRIFRHEGWSFKSDVYNTAIPSNNEDDLWSANVAIPNLLFDDMDQFSKQIPYFKLEGKQKFSEFSVFLASGGTVAKRKTPFLPLFFLKLLDKMDNILVTIAPNVFALQRKLIFVNAKK